MTDDQQARGSAPQRDNWERDVIRKLAEAALSEQRKARRWCIQFK